MCINWDIGCDKTVHFVQKLNGQYIIFLEVYQQMSPLLLLIN